jgi:hypothetical protein
MPDGRFARNALPHDLVSEELTRRFEPDENLRIRDAP